MTIAQLQALITLALAAGLTESDLVYAANLNVALAANAVAPLNANNEVIQLGSYQASSGTTVPAPPARGLYIGLSNS